MGLQHPSLSDEPYSTALQRYLDIPQSPISMAEAEDLVLPEYAFPPKLTVVDYVKIQPNGEPATFMGDPFIMADIPANKIRLWGTAFNFATQKLGATYLESVDGLNGIMFTNPLLANQPVLNFEPSTAEGSLDLSVETVSVETIPPLGKIVGAYYGYPGRMPLGAGLSGRIGNIFTQTLSHIVPGGFQGGADKFVWAKQQNAVRIQPEFDWEAPYLRETAPGSGIPTNILDGGIQESCLKHWFGQNIMFYSTITMLNCAWRTSGTGVGYKDPTISGAKFTALLGRAVDQNGNLCSWKKDRFPIMSLGGENDPDKDMMSQQDVEIEPTGVPGEGHMFYRGARGNTTITNICHAFTQDYGFTWYKNPNNPLLEQTSVVGNFTSGYSRLVGGPSARIINNQWVVYFFGNDNFPVNYSPSRIWKAVAARP